MCHLLHNLDKGTVSKKWNGALAVRGSPFAYSFLGVTLFTKTSKNRAVMNLSPYTFFLFLSYLQEACLHVTL